MRILYIHQHFGTPAGSSGTRSYEFARRLVEGGHRVTMVCGASGRSETGLSGPFARGVRRGEVDGIDVVEYGIGYSTADSIATRLAKFSRFGVAASKVALTDRYDLIFATSTPLTAGIPGILAKLFRRKPFVFEVRDLWPELPRALGVRNPFLLGGMSLLEWMSYHAADGVIGLAPGIVDGIVRRGIRPERTRMIPNGCDLALFDAAAPQNPAERFPGRIAPTDFTCIYAGAHGIANGLDALVDVARELKRRSVAGVKILLVGSGATKPALVRRVEAESLGDYVIFSDPVPKTELIPLIKGCSAGLQILKNVPAFYDGTSPNKFFDYLAAGVPVIVNYPGWIADLVQQADAGRAIPPDDPAAFTDALEGALRDRESWSARGREARRLAGEGFDRDSLAAKFVEVVEATAGLGQKAIRVNGN